MELKEKIAQKILKLKLGKVKNGSHQEIQKLQQEYDKLANENQPNITTK
jgi:DNA gyrase/topoisomerase IV subunit A|tara:strand:+ start:369 stop:515 length:147 start_codon:yes stop_codon:yes gene_type:complete